MALLSTLFDALCAAVPAKPALLRAASRLPPALKARPVFRLCAALARRAPAVEVPSNLGIDARLRWLVPSSNFVLAFGRPDDYRGERGCLALAAALHAKGADAFVDVGAHLGYFTAYVAHNSGSDVPIHAFEPDPSLFSRLGANVSGNKLRGVTIHDAALADRDGIQVFHRNLSDSFSGTLMSMAGSHHRSLDVEVRVTTLSSFLVGQGLRRACVKVDVEGAERLFLDGATGALDRLCGLIIEVLEPAIRSGFVGEVIARTGWAAYYVNDLCLEHSGDGTFRYAEGEYNWFFSPQRPAELAKTLAGTGLTVC